MIIFKTCAIILEYENPVLFCLLTCFCFGQASPLIKSAWWPLTRGSEGMWWRICRRTALCAPSSTRKWKWPPWTRFRSFIILACSRYFEANSLNFHFSEREIFNFITFLHEYSKCNQIYGYIFVGNLNFDADIAELSNFNVTKESNCYAT